MRIRFAGLAILGGLLAISIGQGQVTDGSPDPSPVDRPNVVLLLTDDQCFDTIAALGQSEIQTPAMDDLARRGVSFSNAYNMGGWNGAVCIASRAMLNTGRFLWRAHDVNGKLKQEAAAGRFFAQRMKSQGYGTYFSGKWHVSIPPQEVFDHVRHVRPGMPRDTPSSYQRPGSDDTWQPDDRSLGGFWEGGKHWSEVLAEDAIDYLQEASERPEPFFMYLAFNAPHDPRQAPREFVDQYDREQLAIPPNFLPEYPFAEAMGAGRKLRDERLAPWPRTPEAVQLHRQEYYAAISHLDAQVGRIMEELRRLGLEKNTYVILTSDHGLACGQHGLLGKQSMFEHSMKPPLLIVGPTIDSARRIAEPVYLQDIVPTVLEWAGAEPAEDIEFRSLMPLIRGDVVTQYESIYGAYEPGRQRMLRDGDWKLIFYPEAGKFLLFDLVNDPWEIEDRAADQAQQARLQVMKQRLRETMRQMDDPLLERLPESVW